MLFSIQVVFNDLCRIVNGISEKSFGAYVMAEFLLGILKIKICHSNYQACKLFNKLSVIQDFFTTLIGFESRQMFDSQKTFLVY